MNQHISYYMKCEYCGHVEGYMARSSNVNNTLEDKDILKLVAMHTNNIHEFRNCPSCNKHSLQTRIAWGGLTDARQINRDKDKMNYWEECIKEAFDDVGIDATDEQMENVAAWVGGACENYHMATGISACTKGAESAAERELRELKEQIEIKRVWEATTKPCKICNSSGVVQDGWGRDGECFNCAGKGRI